MIQILLDSAADYVSGAGEGIGCIPLTVSIGDKDYLDGVNLEKDKFYELLTGYKEFPKTSQPTPQMFAQAFENAREQGDEAIYISLSSALSGTYQSACIAREMVDYDGIYLVDSLTATHGIAVLARKAEQMRDAGASALEIVRCLEDLKGRIFIYAAVDTLEYLYKGGRLSRTSAAVGTAAGIKPVITVSRDGEVAVAGKCLGKGRAMHSILKLLEGVEVDGAYPVVPLFTCGTENCEALEEKLTASGYRLGSRGQVGPAIGAHVGPGAYGVVVVAKKK